MDGSSLTPEQEKLNALKQVLPEVFSEGKIDWEKLKATLGENIIALDKSFKGNNQLKTNTVLQMKDKGIEFKTI